MRPIHVLLSGLVLSSCAGHAGEDASDPPAPTSPRRDVEPAAPRVAPEVVEVLRGGSPAQVVVALVDPGGATMEARRAAIRDRQGRVIAAAPTGMTVHHRFVDHPFFSATVTAEGLRALAASPDVRAVGADRRGHGSLAFSVRAIHALEVHHTYGFTGEGVTAAVLDSGADGTHPDLAGAVVAQQCFTHGACPPSNTDQGTESPDGNGHGTSVAAILASRGVFGPSGFAPAAKLVVVRVLDDDASGYVSDWAAGLEWVYQNLSGTPVQVVNMSIGTTALYAAACPSDPGDTSVAVMAGLVSQINASGASLFASTGNAASPTSTTSPACIPGVLGVGATYSHDFGPQPWTGTWGDFDSPEFPACSDATTSLATVTCFTNSGPQLSLLAPGALILTAAPGDELEFWFGTSMASPTAAGTAALMLQANPALTPARIGALLAQTGTMLTDPKNGQSFPRIDALAAVQAAVCDGKADGTSCDDGDACTQGDACAAGVCHGTAVADGTACDDGDACTADDTCTAGACAGLPSVVCTTPPCSFTSECKPETATCTLYTPPHWYDGEACAEGTCSTAGTCSAGACPGTQPVTCPATGECEAASCDPVKGTCGVTTAPDGTACTGGFCAAGACVKSGSTSTSSSSATTTGSTSGGGSSSTGAGGEGGTTGGPAEPASKGCGCQVPGGGAPGRGACLALALLAVARRRRRRA